MRIIFVRHGHPNYEEDCLTELGHRHAEAAAIRLKEDRIDEIYSSTCGRAYETALHTAEKFGLDVTQLEFMREIRWGGEDVPMNGHPWGCAEAMIRGEGLDPFVYDDCKKSRFFKENIVFESCKRISSEIDEWIAQFGYVREGAIYRCTEENGKQIALFSHAGSSSAAISHITNIPFVAFCGLTEPNFTAITYIDFPVLPGELVVPHISTLNDEKHIRGI